MTTTKPRPDERGPESTSPISITRIGNSEQAEGGSARDVHSVLARLHGVKQVKAEEWIALCPAHDDHNPSLSIRSHPDGSFRNLKCWPGCRSVDVLGVLGLELRELLNRDRWGKPAEAQPSAMALVSLSDPAAQPAGDVAVLTREQLIALSNELINRRRAARGLPPLVDDLEERGLIVGAYTPDNPARE